MIDIPGKKHRAYSGNARDKKHRQADAIDRQMIIHPESRNPRHPNNRCEMRKIDIGHEKRREPYRKAGECRDQRDPTRENTR